MYRTMDATRHVIANVVELGEYPRQLEELEFNNHYSYMFHMRSLLVMVPFCIFSFGIPGIFESVSYTVYMVLCCIFL